MNVWTELLVVLALTLVSGLFTGTEVAMLSVRRTRLRELADQGFDSARAALALREKPEVLFATIQIGVTLLSATTAVFGGARLEGPLALLLDGIGLGRFAAPIAYFLVIAFVSYLSLVVGELVPKSLALRSPEGLVLFSTTWLVFFARVMRPFVWLLTASSNLLLRPFKDSTSFSESRLSPDELEQLIGESGSTGTLDGKAADIAARAISLGTRKASALMVPRTKIVSVDVDAKRFEVRELLESRYHARYPIFEGDPEQIIGYVLHRDLERFATSEVGSLRTVTRPVLFVPETVKALEVLRRLQEEQRPFAILVEETGGIAGLLSTKDIAEDLLGSLLDERDSPDRLFEDESDSSFVVRGDAPLHEVERHLGVSIALDHSVTTLSGALIDVSGRIPTNGEVVQLSPELSAEVLEATVKQVLSARLTKSALPEPSSSGFPPSSR